MEIKDPKLEELEEEVKNAKYEQIDKSKNNNKLLIKKGFFIGTIALWIMTTVGNGISSLVSKLSPMNDKTFAKKTETYIKDFRSAVESEDLKAIDRIIAKVEEDMRDYKDNPNYVMVSKKGYDAYIEIGCKLAEAEKKADRISPSLLEKGKYFGWDIEDRLNNEDSFEDFKSTIEILSEENPEYQGSYAELEGLGDTFFGKIADLEQFFSKKDEVINVPTQEQVRNGVESIRDAVKYTIVDPLINPSSTKPKDPDNEKDDEKSQ